VSALIKIFRNQETSHFYFGVSRCVTNPQHRRKCTQPQVVKKQTLCCCLKYLLCLNSFLKHLSTKSSQVREGGGGGEDRGTKSQASQTSKCCLSEHSVQAKLCKSFNNPNPSAFLLPRALCQASKQRGAQLGRAVNSCRGASQAKQVVAPGKLSSIASSRRKVEPCPSHHVEHVCTGNHRTVSHRVEISSKIGLAQVNPTTANHPMNGIQMLFRGREHVKMRLTRSQIRI
jgi:hypothetical protein